MTIEIRTITSDELLEFTTTMARTFGRDFNPEYLERRRETFEFDRNLGAFDDGEVVGTSGIFTYEMTVPGGTLPTAGVTMVTVRSDHRRQGILTGMMAAQLDQVAARGEPMAALWASESVIYGRFGYGLAADTCEFKIDRTRTAMEHAPETPGKVRMVSADQARETWPTIWDRVRLEQPGMMTRSPGWWRQRVFFDPPEWRAGFSGAAYANYEADGEVRGYIKYRMKPDGDARGLPTGTIRIDEMMAATGDAYAALWQYAFSIDLVDTIEAPLRRPDEPLYWMLADPRRLKRTPHDSLWLRIVDVERCLSARSYAVDGRVVFEVSDPFRPGNAGRYALEGGPGGAKCVKTNEQGEVRLDIADLGAVYLGGAKLQTLVHTGRVSGERAALRRADAMLAWTPGPWCPEVF